MIKKFVSPMTLLAIFAIMILGISPAFASEADLVVPSIQSISKDSYTLLLIGLGISVAGLIFGLVEFLKIKKLDVHEVMNNVGILAIDKHVDEFKENVQENILRNAI